MGRPLVSPRLIAKARSLDERLMTSSCRVLRPTVTRTDGETEIDVTQVVAGPVPCRLTRRTGNSREATVLGRAGDEPPAEIALPLGTAVRDQHWIEVTTPRTGLPGEPALDPDVETFEVQGDPWTEDFETSVFVPVWRQDERHG